MNWHRTWGALLVLGAVVSANAAEGISIEARNVTTTIPALKESGFDLAFLPYKKPMDPTDGAKPVLLPFEAGQSLRGVFTPKQLAVVNRAFPAAAGGGDKMTSATLPMKAPLVVPAQDGEAAFSVSAIALPDAKVEVTISGSGATPEQVATVAAGDTMVLSFAGKGPEAVAVYFVTIKKG